ncbi:retrotransposon protein, putative, ty1-copia subclass, partial [Tanacetum coccineum]
MQLTFIAYLLPHLFTRWSDHRIVLLVEDKLIYLEHPIPAAPILTQASPEFHSCKQEEGQSVSSHILKMKSYIDNLERLGHPVSLGLGVSLILISLHKEFDGFVQNYNMHSMGKTINELHAMLKLHEKTLPKNNAPALHAIRAGKGKNKLSYDPKPKIPPLSRKEDPAKDFVCHQCGDIGHWKRNCPYSIYALSNKRSKSNLDSALLWHCHLGHISKKRIEKLQHDLLLNSTDLRAFEKCVLCMSGKMARKPYMHQVERAKDLLGLIHTDVCGLFKIMSRQGASYFVTFTNDFSRYGYVYLLKHKHEVFETFKVFQKEVEYQLERRNRTLLDIVRSMMSQTTLPKSFWGYALETAARILNMVPTKKVEKTPYEVWHGQAPKLSYLKVWGCEALVKRDTLTKPGKLEPRSIKCIFIGYPKETMGYSFYYPPKNKVFVAQNAEFFENSLITQEESGSLEDLEIIQEEDTQPFIDTSINHEEDDQEVDEPQSDINHIRRSTRTRRAIDRLCLHVDAEEHELGDLGEPANYKAALSDPESDKWLDDMNVEMQSMKDNEVWDLVDLPSNGKTIG